MNSARRLALCLAGAALTTALAPGPRELRCGLQLNALAIVTITEVVLWRWT